MAEKVVYLKKARQERFNIKRGWYTTAWRIVDGASIDVVQPWCRTKKEAKETAKSLGLVIKGVIE